MGDVRIRIGGLIYPLIRKGGVLVVIHDNRIILSVYCVFGQNNLGAFSNTMFEIHSIYVKVLSVLLPIISGLLPPLFT